MLRDAMISASNTLSKAKQSVDELNIFPVPDGDTGTNMTMTIMSAAAEVGALTDPDMETLAKAISSGSLRGARGNSGVILSQLLRGFTRSVRKSKELDALSIAAAMEKTASEAGVHIVSGDTKVAGKGQVDGVFITTTGMGQIEDGVKVGGTLAQPGDAIIVTGDVGRHGCTILLAREDFGIEADVTSDCAPLWKTVEAVMNTTHNLHVIRDATRGGVGTVLYEIAGQSNVGIRLDAASVPVAPEVKGVCGMLGLEPLYLACEGRMVIMAPKTEADKIVEALRQCPYSKDAAIIGEVTADLPGKVVMTTEIGTQALLPQPGGELLPRIC